jgi:hypothetical protein
MVFKASYDALRAKARVSLAPSGTAEAFRNYYENWLSQFSAASETPMKISPSAGVALHFQSSRRKLMAES